MSGKNISIFQKTILDFYHNNGRILDWRIPDAGGEFDAYKILVSEVMLQQTQVVRVIPKYQEFLKLFPDFQTLASAPLADVLRAWAGLGYYRRARFLHETAKIIMSSYNGIILRDQAELTQLPGVGQNTAAEVLVYAYNLPLVFIETNIRTVFIHHFFEDEVDISDAKLMPYINESLQSQDPRTWYWALMDYGSFLKQTRPNPGVRSKVHVKQSVFKGSLRFIRGQVLKELRVDRATTKHLTEHIQDKRLPGVLEDLQREGLITKKGQTYFLGR